ncbi:type I-E CRISPR-associated endonuclease Cas1e [Kitasatospora nipponensis]|uniref:CRISPR-associated endonuclease Cas1 n=1 Tax=Kitasatospora nipponensis TaxID=258049 RepID=A0ABN1VKA0_9ACTN
MSSGHRPASTPVQLARVGDRLSFVYLERCIVHRDANAITAESASGTTHIPSATIGTLLLGPGTRITHQAMSILGETGAGVVSVGENGVRYYAGGRALTRSATLAEGQASCWANRRTRLEVARSMYRLRFPGEDVDGLTRRELLGREGRRVKDCYQANAKRTGISWQGRHYKPGDFSSGDPVNQAITAAAQVMYGISHAVVTALGCSPALGFIHSGHELSFVLDIADLYKIEIGIPVAFDTAATSPEDVGPATRRALRDRIHSLGLLDRIVDDIKNLVLPHTAQPSIGADTGTELGWEADRMTLQSDHDVNLPTGTNWDAQNTGESW